MLTPSSLPITELASLRNSSWKGFNRSSISLSDSTLATEIVSAFLFLSTFFPFSFLNVKSIFDTACPYFPGSVIITPFTTSFLTNLCICPPTIAVSSGH